MAVVVTRTLSAPPSKVWAVLEDFGGVANWSAGVEASPIIAGTPERGLGAERNCQLYDGNHINERLTELVPEKRLAIEVTDTSMPMKSAAGRFELVATPGGGTQVTMTMDYVVKFGPIGQLMDVLMLKRSMTASLNNLLAALDEHVETGKRIEKGWKPAAA